ncbi:MAG: Holliday junction resolvase RuvX [Prolixibacteraceae bacterium]|jgi:putative Holliday junction resolvase|nr:Holliday junction resolvase RuvX [Prolixibacteraceae bacterium]
MGRILAIDYGRKRVGVAVTDPLQIIASKLGTVRAHDIFDFLMEYFNKETVECVVVGYPRTLNNEASESIRYVNPFLKQFRKKFPDMQLELVDERFTSSIAHQTMRDAGLKKKDRQNKELVDAVSATIILQTYMEQKRNLKF